LRRVDEGFSVQRSNVTAVTHEYKTPFNFDGKLDSLVINRVPPNLSADEASGLSISTNGCASFSGGTAASRRAGS
jgi:hypothetical protein